MKSNKQKLALKLLPFFFLAIILSIIRINWAWVDDVFYTNNFQSLTTELPIYDPDYFVGLSKIFILLYKTFPNIGWLGFFLLAVMLVVFQVNNTLLIKKLNLQRLSAYKQALYAFIFAVIFSTFFFRLNFTVTGIFCVSSGLLLIENSEKRKTAIIGLLLLFVGVLIRWHVAIIFYFRTSPLQRNKKL